MQDLAKNSPLSSTYSKIALAGLVVAALVVWPGILRMDIETLSFGLFSSSPWQMTSYDASGQVVRTSYSPLAIAGGTSLVLIVLYGVAAGFISLWHNLPKSAGSGTEVPDKVAVTGAQLDAELAAILTFIRSYLGANEAYAQSLIQANKKLPASVTSEQVQMIVKFLIAENEKMHRDASNLKKNLEQSQSQIEKLRVSLAEAEEMGIRDELTALNNRRGFDASLGKQIAEAHARKTPLCLAMADIDHFKKVNDNFGHLVGDEILKMFASLLSGSVKEEDFVARYGGEEFAIILPHTKLEEAKQLTERIRTKFEAKKLAVNKSGQLIGKITASFGVAQLAEGDTARTLLWRADAKLYEAKSGGRNRVVVCETPNS